MNNSKFTPPKDLFQDSFSKQDVVKEDKTLKVEEVNNLEETPYSTKQQIETPRNEKKIGSNYDLEKFKSDVYELISAKLDESNKLIENRMLDVDNSLKTLQELTQELKQISTVYAEINDALFKGNERISNVINENSKEILSKVIHIEETLNKEIEKTDAAVNKYLQDGYREKKNKNEPILNNIDEDEYKPEPISNIIDEDEPDEKVFAKRSKQKTNRNKSNENESFIFKIFKKMGL